jgi:hypothetical protein
MEGKGNLDVAEGDGRGGGDGDANEVVTALDCLHVGFNGSDDLGGESLRGVLGGIKVSLEILEETGVHAGNGVTGRLACEGVHGLGEGISLEFVATFGVSGSDLLSGLLYESSLNRVGESGLLLNEGIELADKLQKIKGIR